MPTELRDKLQEALGGVYVLERELGGGMSRVFVARDDALGRRIVVKHIARAVELNGKEASGNGKRS